MNNRSSDRVSADNIAAHGLKVLTFETAAKSDCGATWCNIGTRELVCDGNSSQYAFRPIIETTLSGMSVVCEECKSNNHKRRQEERSDRSGRRDAKEIVYIFDDESVVNLESNLPDEI